MIILLFVSNINYSKKKISSKAISCETGPGIYHISIGLANVSSLHHRTNNIKKIINYL